MNRRLSDVQVLSLAVLGLAAALATQPLLKITFADGGEPMLSARLAPPVILDRLWVVFVLIPAAIAFLGIGIPYALRVLFTGLRRGLVRGECSRCAGLAACTVLVVVDLVLGRSGVLPLALTCILCAWNERSVLVRAGRGYAAPLLGGTGVALVGIAYYQHRLIEDGTPSVAVAPTLALLAFYSGLVGLLALLMDGLGAPWRKTVWLRALMVAAILGGWLVAARAVHKVTAEAERSEMGITLVAGLLLLWLAIGSSRGRGRLTTGSDERS